MTSLVKSSRLNGATISGYCKLFAIEMGTPTTCSLIFRSEVITVLALKSTRFTIKFPLT